MERLARWCFRRRRAVVAIWLVVVVGAVFTASQAGGEPVNDVSVPGAESQHAVDLLRERFPELAGDSSNLVFRSGDMRDPSVQVAVEGALEEIEGIEHVVRVRSPYRMEAPISADGTIAYAVIQFDVKGSAVLADAADQIGAVIDELRDLGLQVEIGGQALRYAHSGGVSRPEVVGFLAAMVVLLFTFASVVAAGLPIMTAVFALGLGLSLLALAMNVFSIADYAPQVALMLGLGVGIDYALLIVTRYRQGLHSGLEPGDAIAVAITTSGRSVIFAGTTVMISMSGLFLIGLPLLYGLAAGAMTAVFLTMVASVTLLPAVLGFAGHGIDRLPVGRRRRETGHRETAWFRWSRLVQRRPWWGLVAGTLILMTIAAPVFSMRLGSESDATEPRSSSARRAYDLIAEGFGPGFNGPIMIVADLAGASGDTREAIDALVPRLAGVDGVFIAAPPEYNETGDTALVPVIPETDPQSTATDDLYHHLRNEVVPDALAGTGIDVSYAGITPASVDIAKLVQSRLVFLMGGVLLLSFVLLMAVFRSILVPLKAVIVNLLSISAAYGLVVAVFQWGWGASLIGIDRTGPIIPMTPLWLFAVLFGLSMDYEVFLVSRIHEEYVRTGDNGLAVADGLAVTARVITAAATIMVFLFGAFILDNDRVLKVFGVGLASAIFLDAVVVRTLLVPATMELLGRSNWWLPPWLDRVIPRISVEGESAIARQVLEDEVVEVLGATLEEEPTPR